MSPPVAGRPGEAVTPRVDTLAIAIVDSNRDRWGPFSRSDPGFSDSEQSPVKRLKPGAKVSGKVVISVAKRSKPKAVRHEAGALGPPVEVRIGR